MHPAANAPGKRAAVLVTPREVALSLLSGIAIGTVVALGAAWWPAITASLRGPEPPGYWYLSRASGLVAYVLIWLSVALGLLITGKLARLWPGGPAVADLHQYSGLLGMGFGLFHAAILLGDSYTSFTAAQLLLPFSTAGYRPPWVGLGQVAFYLGLLVVLSGYVRRRVGYRVWRLVHFSSFAVYLFATLHGLAAGTDSTQAPVFALYSLTASVTFFLTVYRVLSSVRIPRAVTG